MKIVVAPLAGARIEIPVRLTISDHVVVAPLAGARIEIAIPCGKTISTQSLPSRERGLKL